MSRWALVLGASLAACTKPPAIVVERIDVDAFVGGDIVSMTEGQLRDELARALGAAKVLVLDGERRPPDGARPWRVQLAAGLSEPELEQQTSVVQALIEFSHSGDREGFEVRGHQLVKAAEGNDPEAMEAALRDALDQVLRRAAREAAAVISLDALDGDALAKRLSSRDPAMRAAAVRLLARRRDEAALPALLARLKSDDVDELREVMGLLVELRSPQAVNPLVEAARQRGPQFEREVVFAVGAIGGENAEAYLDLIATGHDDPVLRASAEQALAELRQRRAPEPGDKP